MNVKVLNTATEYKKPPSAQAMLTVSGTATDLATLAYTIPAGASHIVIQATDQPLRVTFDGTTTPTAAVGKSVPALGEFTVPVDLAPFLKFIRQGATDVVLWVQAFGY